MFILSIQRNLPWGGTDIPHYYSNKPDELGGWRPNPAEATPIPYHQALQVLHHLTLDGIISIKTYG